MSNRSDTDTDHEGLPGSMKRLAEDVIVLVRKELELARAEMTEKAKSAGMGAGMLSGSAVTGMLTLGSLTALIILGLSTVMAAWLAALIVTVLWGAVTAVLALMGKKKLQETSLVPEQTIQNVKEDVQWATQSAKKGKHV